MSRSEGRLVGKPILPSEEHIRTALEPYAHRPRHESVGHVDGRKGSVSRHIDRRAAELGVQFFSIFELHGMEKVASFPQKTCQIRKFKA